MAYQGNILDILNPPEDDTTRKNFLDIAPANLSPKSDQTLESIAYKTLHPELDPKAYVSTDERQRREDLSAAHNLFFSDPTIATPQYQLDKAKALLDKQTAEAVAPLENFYNYQQAGGPVLNVPANASPSQKAFSSAISTNIAEQAPVTPGSVEALQQYTNLKAGKSYRMLQDLGLEFPGTGKTAPVFQSDAPEKGVGIGKVVPNTAPLPVDKTGLTSTIGSEFGEVDNPARGGYTEAGWNVGAWGHEISGKDTKLVALPVSVLKGYGDPAHKDFATKFNSQYDIQVIDPKTGKAAVSQLGDKGPGASTGAGIDLTMGTRATLGLPENFKGPVQYRVVRKGSALPDGTTSTAGGATADGTTTAAAGQPDLNTYIQPVDPKKLRDPEIYGGRNTPADNLLWARNQADQYAIEMAKAGTPLTVEEYKDRFKTFADATEKKAKGEAPTQLQREDTERFGSLAMTIPELDALMEVKKVVKGGPGGIGYGNAQADFYAKLNLLSPNISKGLGGQTGTPSDSDIKRAEQLLPTDHDSVEEAQTKIDYLKKLTTEQMGIMIRIRRSQHYDTSGLEQEYKRLFPQVAASEVNKKLNTNADILNKNVPGQAATPSLTPQQQKAAAEAGALRLHHLSFKKCLTSCHRILPGLDRAGSR